MKRSHLLGLTAGLVGCVSGVYAGGLQGEFFFDDHSGIVNNQTIREFPLLLERLPATLRPVTEVSFALNHAATGLNPTAFRAVNVALHGLTTVILFGLVRVTLNTPRCRAWAAGRVELVAFGVALLWAVHPLNSQAVICAVQRAQVLAGLFQFATLYAFARGAGADRGRGWWYLAAAAAAALAVGSKQDAVVLPLLVVLYDRVFLSPTWRAVASRWFVHLPLFATLGLLTSSFAFALVGTPVAATPAEVIGPPAGSSESASATAGFTCDRATSWQYLLTQLGVIPHYLKLAVWPDALSLDYYDWPLVRSVGDVPLTALVTVALLGGTAVAWVRRPVVGFLGGWVVLNLAPTSSVMPIDDLVVEHRMYSALAGLVALAVVGCVAVLDRVAAARGNRWLLAVTLLVGVGLATRTAVRAADFRTPVTVWQRAAETRPGNWRAEHNLAIGFVQQGKTDDAIRHFERAAELQSSAATHAMLAETFVQCGRPEKAVQHYRRALASGGQPSDRLSDNTLLPPFQLHFNLAKLLADRGEYTEAVEHYRASAESNPKAIEPRISIKRPLAALGRWDEAAVHLGDAVRLAPDSPIARTHYALVLVRLKKYEEAAVQFERAAAATPNDPRVFGFWGRAMLLAGKPAEAVTVFRRGLDCRPTLPRLLAEYAFALRRSGNESAAVAAFAQASKLAPDQPDALASLAWELATHPQPHQRDPVEAVLAAEVAVEATDGKRVDPLDAAAAAYAAARRFDEAVACGEKAAALAVAQPPRAAAIRARVDLFRQQQPFIQPVP